MQDLPSGSVLVEFGKYGFNERHASTVHEFEILITTNNRANTSDAHHTMYLARRQIGDIVIRVHSLHEDVHTQFYHLKPLVMN